MFPFRFAKVTSPVVLLLLAGTPIAAQLDLSFDATLPVSRQGAPLDLAWGGGLNYAQLSEIDLDQDGLRDLIFFDRIGNKVVTLLNTGASGTERYRVTRDFDQVRPFPTLSDWALFRDYDCDGKMDIFTFVSAGFSVYRNTSTDGALSFELLTYRAKCDFVFPDGSSQVSNLYVTADDIPGFADVDGDGDLDVLTFGQLGAFVQYYKNMSLEERGTCDSLDFVLRNACWGRFSEAPATNDINMNAPCPTQVPAPELTGNDGRTQTMEPAIGAAKAHSGSSVTPLDLDGDGVMDLLLGDISYTNLVALSNGGTVDDSFITAVSTNFPEDDTPVQVTIFPAAFHLDVDGDDQKDVIVCPSARSLAHNYKSVWYYKNMGTNASPQLEFQQDDLFQGRMIDLGEGACPIPFDHNGDGSMDLLLANDGYFDPTGDYIGKLALLENVGSPTAPAFEWITDDYMALSTSGIGRAMYPAFSDVDGDGDQDMYIGDLNGMLHFYRNTSTGPVAQFVLAQPNVTNSSGEVIDLGRYATPFFIDWDEDGLEDLVIGEQNGNLNYLRNTGSASAAAWTFITDSMGSVSTTTQYTAGHSVPWFFMNAQGQRELMVGTESGTLWHYTDLTADPTASWTLADSSFMDMDEGYRSALSLLDITGDGELDLFVGNYAGGLSFWRSDAISTVPEPTWKGGLWAWPNPTRGLVELELPDLLPSGTLITVRNGVGQVLGTIPAVPGRTRTDLSHLAEGSYFLHLETRGVLMPPMRILIMH